MMQVLAIQGLTVSRAFALDEKYADLLRQTAPKTTVHADRRFVDNGRVVCSAGIAAGIDMSLHVIARLLGKELAEKTARQVAYPLEAPASPGGAPKPPMVGHARSTWLYCLEKEKKGVNRCKRVRRWCRPAQARP
jgi:transcriptional regulator GlxA family with amidase domain